MAAGTLLLAGPSLAMASTSSTYGGTNGIVDTNDEADAVIRALWAATDTAASSLRSGLVTPAELTFVTTRMRTYGTTSYDFGGPNGRIDQTSEQDPLIQALWTKTDAQATTLRAGLLQGDTGYLNQRQPQFGATSASYGGPNGRIDQTSEQDALIQALWTGTDAQATTLRAGLLQGDTGYLNQRQPQFGTTSASYGGPNGRIDQTSEQDALIQALWTGTDAQATTLRAGLLQGDTGYLNQRQPQFGSTSSAYGGPNGRIDQTSEQDALIQALWASTDAQAATLRASLLQGDTGYLNQRQPQFGATSASYGGPNGRVDTSAETSAVVDAYRSASDDSTAGALYSGLLAGDQVAVDSQASATFSSGGTYRKTSDGSYWGITGGQRYYLATAGAASTAGFNLSASTRATPGSLSNLTRGEDITDSNARSWQFGGSDHWVNTADEADSFLGAFRSTGITDAGALSLYQGLRPSDQGYVDGRITSGAIARNDVLRAIPNGQLYYVGKDGYSFAIESRQVGLDAGIDVDSAKRSTSSAIASLPVGDPLTAASLNSPGETSDAIPDDQATRLSSDSGYLLVGKQSFDFTTADADQTVRMVGTLLVYRGKGSKELIRRFEFGAGSKVYAQGPVGCFFLQLTYGYPAGSFSPGSVGIGGASTNDGWTYKCKPTDDASATRPTAMSIYGVAYAKKLLNSVSIQIARGTSSTAARQWPSFKKMGWGTVTPVS